MSEYTPPEIWMPKAHGGQFDRINRPVAGATHDRTLPVGEHPHQLYSLATPNGVKATLMFEELLERGIAEAEYDAWPININEGEQFSSAFVEVNPNSKIPALLDRSTDPPTCVWESGSILLYLANKFGAFLPEEPRARTEAMSWLFWQVGSGGYLGGGFGHFYNYAPIKIEYAIDRYAMEVKRQLDLLDKRLAEQPFLAGEAYSIADMAVWPWYGALVMGKLYSAGTFLQVHEYTHVIRWAQQIRDRPAARRARRVNRPWGPEETRVVERHGPEDFE